MRIPAAHSITPPTPDCYAEARDAFVGDPASELAALLIDHIRDSRQSYLEQTRAEQNHLRVVQAAQVKDLRHEADKTRDAGVTKGVGLVASGALCVGSSFVTASGPSAAETSTPDCANPCPPEAPPETDWASLLKGGARGAEGIGEVGAAHFNREAGYARADATEHEHLGSEAARRLEVLDEARSRAKELERSAIQHLGTIQETRASIDRALTSWRG